VNYSQYSQLLLDAKAKTNAASRELSEGPVKKALNEAIDAYVDAGKAWSEKIRSSDNRLYLYEEPGKTLITKYGLPVESSYWDPQYPLKQFDAPSIEFNAAIQLIWQQADARLEELAKTLQPKA